MTEPLTFFFDFETSGFHKKTVPFDDPTQAWPVQLGFILSDSKRVYHECAVIFKPPHPESSIHPGAAATHGISLEHCNCGGVAEEMFSDYLLSCLDRAELLVCHNYNFDSKFMSDLLSRCHGISAAKIFGNQPHLCTMLTTTEFCHLPGRYGKPKWPKLEELHRKLFNEDFEGAHDALADVRATRRCYYELRKLGVIE